MDKLQAAIQTKQHGRINSGKAAVNNSAIKLRKSVISNGKNTSEGSSGHSCTTTGCKIKRIGFPITPYKQSFSPNVPYLHKQSSTTSHLPGSRQTVTPVLRKADSSPRACLQGQCSTPRSQEKEKVIFRSKGAQEFS